MKKFLLCMMLAGLMMPVVAQEKLSTQKMAISHVSDGCDLGNSNSGILPVNSRGILDANGWESAGMSQSYDRQTQRSVYPMTAVHDDGFIGVTWTNEDNFSNPFEGSANPLRGVGYSYSTDGGLTWSWNKSDPEKQENRIGGIPLYWPSYAQWGKNGEAVLARSNDTHTYEYNGEEIEIVNGLVLLTRETKGEGDWTITPVPYPEGASNAAHGHVMAWARMATSGPNHQYIHIMSPMSTPEGGEPFMGYYTPTFYYRTQDGGATWDIQGQLVPKMVGQEWEEHDGYVDGINFAVRGDIVACSFMRLGFHDYLLKSYDNGNTWENIKFFDNPVGYYLYPEDYNDTCYAPAQGCIALDLNGKVHVAMGMVGVKNSEDEGYISYYYGLASQFLSYWNEDMLPLDGGVDFVRSETLPKLYDEYFDFDLGGEDGEYVISTVPKWPVIGYFTPISGNFFRFAEQSALEWAGQSYGIGGMFSYPQMAFDADNKLHLVYLGLLDNGGQGGDRWIRHPYFTTTADGGKTWTQTEYPINFVEVIDYEFAYLTLAGLYDDKMYLMAQTDPKAGIYVVVSGAADHPATDNNFTVFYLDNIPTPPPPDEGIEDRGTTSFPMIVQPNPASGQATVKFAGKGNITVYNMLGQAVYHVENVENQKDIPLNMASGVYFVTVRSGNATATQKLVVK